MKLFSKVNAALVLLLIPVLFGAVSCSKQTPDTTSKDSALGETASNDLKPPARVGAMNHVAGNPVVVDYIAADAGVIPATISISGIAPVALQRNTNNIAAVPGGPLRVSLYNAAGADLLNGYQVPPGALNGTFERVNDATDPTKHFYIAVDQAQNVVVIMDENLLTIPIK